MPVKPITDTEKDTETDTESRHATVGLPPIAYRTLRALAHGVNRAYWRVTQEGPGRVPVSGPVILAPVHRSNIDFLVASEVTKRKLFYMAKDSLWKAPRFGAFLESIGAFPVNRDGADRLALDRAQDVLERGEALILFPEGTRRSGPVVEELHEGAAFLAARTGAPIVPIGIGGSAAAMPKGSKMVYPVKIHLVVGEPLDPPPRSARGRVPRHQVHELTEQLRAELQLLYDRAQLRVGER
jgi:1-acyl-sn-glycerol-3-phosphate acyltransferase